MVIFMNYRISIFNHKFDKLVIILTYLLLLAIYFLGNSTAALILYIFLIVLSLEYNFIPLMLIGCANFLPTIYGFSPILFSSIDLFSIIIYKGIVNKKIEVFKIKYNWKFLIIFSIWSLITGVSNGNISFFSNVLMAVIFLILIFGFYYTIDMTSQKMIEYLFVGMSTGLILTLMIQMGINGFTSNHSFRLAIGERSDPNSTGLLFAIFGTYLLIKISKNITESILMTVIYTIVLIFSIICLFLTQSRGSFFSLIIVFLIYILGIGRKYRKINKKALLGVVILIAIFFIVISTNAIQESILNSWEALFSRLSFSEEGDGERLYLLEESFKSFMHSPIFGTSLSEFEKVAGHIPHNTFSDYMVTNGVVGILFFIVFFFKPLISCFKYRNEENILAPYFCYMTCFINSLCYSASNEKLLFLLLAIVAFSIFENKTQINQFGK